MSHLSYTQKYFLCTVDTKGNIPATMSSDVKAALFTAGMLELFYGGFIETGRNRNIVITKPLDSSKKLVLFH